jgi:hypothetical protein
MKYLHLWTALGYAVLSQSKDIVDNLSKFKNDFIYHTVWSLVLS